MAEKTRKDETVLDVVFEFINATLSGKEIEEIKKAIAISTMSLCATAVIPLAIAAADAAYKAYKKWEEEKKKA